MLKIEPEAMRRPERPWTDTSLLGARRREAAALGVLLPQDLLRHAEQQQDIRERARRVRDHALDAWDLGAALLEAYHSGYWLRDPQHQDAAFLDYASFLVREVFYQAADSRTTVRRRMDLASAYTREEVARLAAQGVCVTAMTEICDAPPAVRRVLEQMAGGATIAALQAAKQVGEERLRRAGADFTENDLQKAMADALSRRPRGKRPERRENERDAAMMDIEAQQRELEAWAAALRAREAELSAREKQVAEREAAIARREAAPAQGPADLGGALNALAAAVAQVRGLAGVVAGRLPAGEQLGTPACALVCDTFIALQRAREEAGDGLTRLARELMQRYPAVMQPAMAAAAAKRDGKPPPPAVTEAAPEDDEDEEDEEADYDSELEFAGAPY